MPMGGSFITRREIRPKLTKGRPKVGDQQQSFAGGLNSVSSEDALAPDQIRRADNGRLTIFGAFTPRGGTQRIHATQLSGTNTVQNGFGWYKSDGTVLTMAVSQGTLFTTTYGTFPVTWTQRGSAGGMSTTVTPSFASFISGGATETVYIADGGLLNKYAGTTLTTNLAATPSCTFIWVHNQRLWGTGDSSAPDTLYYSALNDGDSLGVAASGGGAIIDRTFGKSTMTGGCSLASSAMLFHEFGVSRLTGFGQSDITVSPAGITGDVGTIAPFSIARVENVVYFIAQRGLFAATEQDVTAINTPERPDPLSIILPLMSRANIAKICALYNRGTRELWIMVPGYGVYVFHTVLKAWTGPWADGYESPEVSCLFQVNNSSGYPIVLCGDASGWVRVTDPADVYLDNVLSDSTGGTSYVATLQCRRFYCEDPQLAKAFEYGYVLADLGGSTASAFSWMTTSATGTTSLPLTGGTSWGGSGTMWGAGTWGAGGQSSYRISLDGNGYYVSVTITNSGQALPVFSQVRVEGVALGRR